MTKAPQLCPVCKESPLIPLPDTKRFYCSKCKFDGEFTEFNLKSMVAQLPSPIAFPLDEYLKEKHPVLKLWHASDFVEMLLRMLLMMGVSDFLTGQERLPDKLARRLSGLIERPTMGNWHRMVEFVARDLDPQGTFIPELKPYVLEELVPFLDGTSKSPNHETSFIALRNRLAHGGGMTKKRAQKLLEVWQGRFETIVLGGSWLERISLIVQLPSGRAGELRGTACSVLSGAVSRDDESFSEYSPDTVLATRETRKISLWPLALFSEPQTDLKAPSGQSHVLQIYFRCGEALLQYLPIGCDSVCISEGNDRSLQHFRRLFCLDIVHQDTMRKKWEVQGFEHDIKNDADQTVGREKEFNKLDKLFRCEEYRLIWLAGQAGIGKSFLFARLAWTLLDAPPPAPIVFPYRFKQGDGRCSPESFLVFCRERLEDRISPDQRPKDSKQMRPVDLVRKLLSQVTQDRRVCFLLDGLDEITARDPNFVREVILPLTVPRTSWFCVGRPEHGLPEMFRAARAFEPFRDGLPDMSEGDIRTMLLQKTGPLAKKLVELDQDQEGLETVKNTFISRVVKAAAGLPIYVKYLIGDILNGRIVPSGTAIVPPSLDDYHEEQIRRCSVGDLHQILTPLVAILAVAHEPLNVEQLASLLTRRSILPGEEDDLHLVRRGLAKIASMIRLTVGVESGDAYTLFHYSLREHILRKSKDMSKSVKTAQQAMAEAVLKPLDDAAASYLGRQGIRHLIEAGRYSEAVSLLHELRIQTGDRDDLANAACYQNIRELLSVLPDFKVEECKNTDPLKLLDLVCGLDDFDLAVSGLSMISTYHPNAWRKCIDRILNIENWDLLYATSFVLTESLKNKTNDQALNSLSRHLESESYSERELGAYAYKLFCLGNPWAVETNLINQIALDSSPLIRSVIYELLLNLAITGRDDVTQLVQSEKFWHPYWGYNQTQLDDIRAAYLLHVKRTEPDEFEEPGVLDAYQCLAATEKVRLRLRDQLKNTPSLQDLLLLVQEPAGAIMHWGKIRKCGNALEESPHVWVMARYLLGHASWEVREAAASMLVSVRSLAPHIPDLIQKYMQDQDWRLKYSAVNLAYLWRGEDDSSSFIRAIRACHGDIQPWVRGVCSHTLRHWLRMDTGEPLEKRLRFMSDIIAAFLGDEDIWVMADIRELLIYLRSRKIDLNILFGPEQHDQLRRAISWSDMEEGEFYEYVDPLKRPKGV